MKKKCLKQCRIANDGDIKEENRERKSVQKSKRKEYIQLVQEMKYLSREKAILEMPFTYINTHAYTYKQNTKVLVNNTRSVFRKIQALKNK